MFDDDDDKNLDLDRVSSITVDTSSAVSNWLSLIDYSYRL